VHCAPCTEVAAGHGREAASQAQPAWLKQLLEKQASQPTIAAHILPWDPLTIQYLNSCAPLRGTWNKLWVIGNASTSLANTKWKWTKWLLQVIVAVAVIVKKMGPIQTWRNKKSRALYAQFSMKTENKKKDEWNKYSRTNSWSHECHSDRSSHGHVALTLAHGRCLSTSYEDNDISNVRHCHHLMLPRTTMMTKIKMRVTTSWTS
jgi:hypothetical protein